MSDLMNKHYRGLADLPSDMPIYRRIAELVSAGCADTSRDAWTHSYTAASLEGFIVLSLQPALIRALGQLRIWTHHPGVSLGVFLAGGRIPRTLPPASGSGSIVKEFGEAQRLLEGLRKGLHMPGDAAKAVGLLMQAYGELEFAISAPAGFGKAQGRKPYQQGGQPPESGRMPYHVA